MTKQFEFFLLFKQKLLRKCLREINVGGLIIIILGDVEGAGLISITVEKLIQKNDKTKRKLKLN